MVIKNHRMDDIWYKQTSNLSSGTIEPGIIVTHYTTGWSGEGSRDWLLGAAGNTSNTKSSAHVVIDRDGTAWQIAPFNRRAWHAGPSAYAGLTDINSHSVGLEFVNPGWLKPAGNDVWYDYFGNKKRTKDLEAFGGYELHAHSRVGSGTFAWCLFTPEQIKTGLKIASALVDKYKIKAVVTHEEIDTRGWKTDPGPAFLQSAFQDLVRGVDYYVVAATRLNLRGGAGTEFETILPPGYLPSKTTVRVVNRSGGWAFVQVVDPSENIEGLKPGLRGWVHTDYLDPVFS